jgi:lysophospholipase L1-like esterase
MNNLFRILILFVLVLSACAHAQTPDVPAGSNFQRPRLYTSPTVKLWDTFNGASGSSLLAHTPDTGGTWTLDATYVGGAVAIASAGGIRSNSGSADALVYNTTAMTSANQGVMVDFTEVSESLGGMVLDYDVTTHTGYMAIRASGKYQIYEITGHDSFTQLGADMTSAVVSGLLRFERSDPGDGTVVLSLWIDQVLLGTRTDSLTIRTGSKVGFWIQGGVNSDASGIRMDNLVAYDLHAPLTYVYCLGTSITLGTTGGATAWTATLADLLGPSYQIVNGGVSGETTPRLLARTPAAITTISAAPQTVKIAVYEGGVNDLMRNMGAAQAHEYIAAACRAIRATGVKVIVCTVLPESSASTAWVAASKFNSARKGLNVAIRNSWSEYADAICDVAANPLIGDDGDSDDTNLFNADKIHLITLGNLVYAGEVAGAIHKVLAGGQASSFPDIWAELNPAARNNYAYGE